MIIAIGCDHAGFLIKHEIMNDLKIMGIELIECGSFDTNEVDFPDIAKQVCDLVRNGNADRGIMICGTGVGASIAANKVPGIRAAVCHDIHSAHQCVEHDNVNVMCLGAQIVGPWLMKDLIRSYVTAELKSEEQFIRRIAKIHSMEIEYAKELLR